MIKKNWRTEVQQFEDKYYTSNRNQKELKEAKLFKNKEEKAYLDFPYLYMSAKFA